MTPLLSLPSCCKEETNQFSVMINDVCNQTKVDVFATDGDATRRRVFCGMMKPIKDKEINALIKRMPLFDLTLVNGEKALYLDDKHNGKRMRTVIISDTRGCKINGTVISRDQLNYVFEKADIKNTKTIREPSDKQNVPAVINLYEALKEAVKFCETNTDRVLKEVEQPMKILLHIFDGILAIFTDLKIDLSKQLIRLSKLSHILFHQYIKLVFPL